MDRPALVSIPAGHFLMGCERGRDEEKPEHRVWVDAFELGVHQVRNCDYAVFLKSTGHTPPPEWNSPHFDGPDQPVVSVNWHDAVMYCEWLSSLGTERFRLPAEAEWERAARGGEEGLLYPWGNDAPGKRADYVERWGGEVRGPRAVGETAPNAYGVHDLCENVHEWCADWFDRQYYAVSPERNPAGPEHGVRKASRGGSWRHHVKVSRCAARSSIPPVFHYADYGFRICRSAGSA